MASTANSRASQSPLLHVGSIEARTTPVHQRLILLAITLAPLQHAFTLPDPWPVRLPSEMLLLAAIGLYILSAGKRARPPRAGDRNIVTLLGISVTATGLLAILSSPGSEIYRQYLISPEFDTLWFTARAVIVLTVWFATRGINPTSMSHAFRIAIWISFFGVILQQALLASGRSEALSALGFNTRTSGVLLAGATSSLARSGTFPNGQELGFFSGACLIIALWCRYYASAVAAAYCLVYSMSTTGFVGVAAALLVLIVLSKSTRVKLAATAVATLAVAIIASSTYLRSLLDFQLAKLGIGVSETISQATQSLEIRTLKTQIAFDMMLKNPLTGVGSGRFGNHAHEHGSALAVPERTLVTVENAFGQIGAEHGIVALALIALLFAWFGVRAIRQQLPFALALIVFLSIAISTQSMWTQSAIWLLLGYIASWIRTTPVASSHDLISGPGRPPRVKSIH